METIYGVDWGHTLKKLCDSNDLYQDTIIWSDCNVCNNCSRSAMKSAARSFPWPTWAFGSESPSPIISFRGIYSTTLHWHWYMEGKKPHLSSEKFGSSSTLRNGNLPFFLVLLIILHCKLINDLMPLYTDVFDHFSSGFLYSQMFVSILLMFNHQISYLFTD